LSAFHAGFLVTGFARLLRGACSCTVGATVVAPLHALRLCGHRRDASEHHDSGQDTNASPKPHLSLRAVSPLVQRSFVETFISVCEGTALRSVPRPLHV
jgi:hypothetical protein